MSIYVDSLVEWGRRPGWPYPSACHLYADTPEELHDFAARLGLKRAWCSDRTQPGSIVLHYDLNASKRATAVGMGAEETDHRHLVARKRSIEERKAEVWTQWAAGGGTQESGAGDRI